MPPRASTLAGDVAFRVGWSDSTPRPPDEVSGAVGRVSARTAALRQVELVRDVPSVQELARAQNSPLLAAAAAAPGAR
jgi:hypothetical protein